MSFLIGLFKKKQLVVEDSEMVWKRDTDDNYSSVKTDMIPNQQIQTNVQSSTDYQTNNRVTSSISVPPWASSINQQYEIKSPYVDISPNNPEKPYNIRRRISSHNSSQNFAVEEPSSPTYVDVKKEQCLSQPQLSKNQSSDRFNKASSWNRGNRNQEANPKLKDFYELETRINRKMMEEEQNRKTPLKKTDIFNPETEEPQTFGFNFYQQNQKKAQVAVSSLPTEANEITARRDFEKRKIKIFETPLSENLKKNSKTSVLLSSDQKDSKISQITSSDVFEESLESGKTFDELLADHHTKQRDLILLEEHYFRLLRDPRNVTIFENDYKESKTRLEKEKSRMRNLQTELKLVSEEILGKNDLLLQLGNNLSKMKGSLPDSFGEKENTLKEIEMYHGKLQKEKESLNSYAAMNEGKNRKMKDLSEKTMNDELTGIKTRIGMFTEDLINELSYFANKIVGGRR